MKLIDVVLIIIACILFCAIIIISDYEMNEERCNTPIDNLTIFLMNDSTDVGIYDFDNYHCVHFSVALIDNLTDAGYNATPIILATSRPGLWSHMVVSVNLDNETVYVDPRSDCIFSPSNWDDEILLGDEIVNVNVSVARSMMNEVN